MLNSRQQRIIDAFKVLAKLWLILLIPVVATLEYAHIISKYACK